MQAWARWALLFVVCALSASVTLQARAEFPEGCTPEYLARFDERLRTMDYDCRERLREPVATRSGTRHIRIIHDLNADWIMTSSEMREFDRSVRLSIEAIGRLGGVELEDVTILLADDFPPREDANAFTNIAALTETVNDGECRIIVYLVGPASRPEYAAWLLAHEIFHCVQAANLTEAQLATSGGLGEGEGGDWWLEGTANWFAAFAIPEIGPMRQFTEVFDDNSPTTSLNRMSYGTVVFFLWYAESSPASIMSFMRAMPGSNAESAQHAAMASAVSQSRWLEFAQAYLDSEIRHPHGADLGLNPQRGDIWTWSATRTQELTLEPFVLARGVAAFECGRWSTRVRPAPQHSARTEDGGAWSTLPSSIDTTSGSGGSYRVVAINATGATTRLAVTGTMESGCGACLGVTETDSCLVGTWQVSGGGISEWMRAQGFPGNFSTSNQSITFRRDGSYATSAMQGSFDMSAGDSRGSGNATAQATGRWSARRGGSLNMCADTQALSGRGTITTPAGSRDITARNPGPGDLQMSYTCAGATLSTIQPMPRGAPSMSTTYTRQAE